MITEPSPPTNQKSCLLLPPTKDQHGEIGRKRQTDAGSSVKHANYYFEEHQQDPLTTGISITSSLNGGFDEAERSDYSPSQHCTSGQQQNGLKACSNSIIRTVHFGTVQVRFYGRTVDDHPCAETGPALTLTWDVQQEESLTMDEFEGDGCRCRCAPHRVPPHTRRTMLLQDWNVPPQDLRNAMYSSQNIQRKRRETLYELHQQQLRYDAPEEPRWWYEVHFPNSDDEDETPGEDWCASGVCGGEIGCSSVADITTCRWQQPYVHHMAEDCQQISPVDYFIDAEEEVEPHLLAYPAY